MGNCVSSHPRHFRYSFTLFTVCLNKPDANVIKFPYFTPRNCFLNYDIGFVLVLKMSDNFSTRNPHIPRDCFATFSIILLAPEGNFPYSI